MPTRVGSDCDEDCSASLLPANIANLSQTFESCGKKTVSLQGLCSHVCVTAEHQLTVGAGLVIQVQNSYKSPQHQTCNYKRRETPTDVKLYIKI